MKSHFELTPAQYERQRQGHLHERRARLIADSLSAVRGCDVVLEIGCGPGDILAAVASLRPQVSFVGIDLDEAMIEHARATHGAPNVRFERRDLVASPAELRARLVYGIDMLHHVHVLEPFVAAVARLLAEEGTWIVIEPNSRNPYIWLHQERMRRAGLDEAHFRRRLFERACAQVGLRIVERTTAFVVPGFVRSVPRPLARAERALERLPALGGSVIYRVATAA